MGAGCCTRIETGPVGPHSGSLTLLTQAYLAEATPHRRLLAICQKAVQAPAAVSEICLSFCRHLYVHHFSLRRFSWLFRDNFSVHRRLSSWPWSDCFFFLRRLLSLFFKLNSDLLNSINFEDKLSKNLTTLVLVRYFSRGYVIKLKLWSCL